MTISITTQKRVYLAGSANAKKPEVASKEVNVMNWREKATDLFKDACVTVSPFRGKERLPNGSYSTTVYTPNEIVTRDLRDIQSCDVVLAEMIRTDYNYIGTAMEIRAAAESGIPVVMWCHSDVANHYWIQYHTVKYFYTLEECCAYIKSYWCE